MTVAELIKELQTIPPAAAIRMFRHLAVVLAGKKKKFGINDFSYTCSC